MHVVDSNSFSREKMVRSLDLISSTCDARCRKQHLSTCCQAFIYYGKLVSSKMTWTYVTLPVCGCPSRSPTLSWRSAPDVAGAPLAGHQPSSCLLGSYCWEPRLSVSLTPSARLSPAGASLAPGQRSAVPPPWLPEWAQCAPSGVTEWGKVVDKEDLLRKLLRTKLLWGKVFDSPFFALY